MRIRQIVALTIAILSGGQAMAGEMPFYNQKMLDAYKREIGYENIVRNLPKDKRVMMNWFEALADFTDSDGVRWTGEVSSAFIVGSGGHLNAQLQSGEGKINIQVDSLREGQRAAVDHALREVATTSMAEINSDVYQPCFADFCLALRTGHSVSELHFVYGNIYVSIGYFNVFDKSVIPVARYLHAEMEKAVLANPEGKLPARPAFEYIINPKRIVEGELFTVSAKPGPGYERKTWPFDTATDKLCENVEYNKNLGGHDYEFNALKSGQGTVAFNLMDVRTLWVFTDTIDVNILPKTEKRGRRD